MKWPFYKNNYYETLPLLCVQDIIIYHCIMWLLVKRTKFKRKTSFFASFLSGFFVISLLFHVFLIINIFGPNLWYNWSYNYYYYYHSCFNSLLLLPRLSLEVLNKPTTIASFGFSNHLYSFEILSPLRSRKPLFFVQQDDNDSPFILPTAGLKISETLNTEYIQSLF